MRIGIAGLGTVGRAVFGILQEQSEKLAQKCGRRLEVAAVSARSYEKALQNGLKLQGIKWYDNAQDLAIADNIDIFVEVIGGGDGIAYAAVSSALKAGRPVVTANKALLAQHGLELAALAERRNVRLYYEAAIAGGIPIVKTLRESLAGNSVTRVYGILNGTCNYILTRMEEEGLPFAACLEEAQKLGYAEADPGFDIDGQDTAHKLALLASLAFGTKPVCNNLRLEGIRSIEQADIQAARDLGYRIKLLGVAAGTETGIEQSVQPALIPVSSPIAQIRGVTNAIMVESPVLGELLLSGAGAGGHATASAIIGDIADIAKAGENAGFSPVFSIAADNLGAFVQAAEQIRQGGYFIRLNVRDKIGVFASVAQIMAQNGISLKSIVQKERDKAEDNGNTAKTIILITHATKESAVAKALAALAEEDYLLSKPQRIRIERPGCGI